MRHPSLYFTALDRAADQLAQEAEDAWDNGAVPVFEELKLLEERTRAISARWKRLGSEGGEIMLETWQLLGKRIDEWPWVEPSHPAFESLHENMMHNDVT